MTSDSKIPREMVGDIILTFLLGVNVQSYPKHSKMVASYKVPFYTSWKDIFSLREAIVSKMSGTDIKEIRKLAKALKKVWKL